jgi:very-short-patch-repair endonuclease
VIGEYQGEHHATLRRRDLDNRRRLQAEGRGWTVIEVFASDIFHGTRRVACLQRFAEALGCDTRQLDLS